MPSVNASTSTILEIPGVLGQGASSEQLLGGSAPATGSTATPATGGTPAPTQPGGFGGLGMLFPIILLFVFMIVMQVMTSRKERKKRDQLMSTLKKHDKVLTIGGMIGVVDQVRDDEVVLKVDENSNMRMRFTKPAIQQILNSSPATTDTAPAVEVKTTTDRQTAGARG